MATHMPVWMLGTDVNTVVLTPQTITYSANKAVLADGSGKDVTAMYRTLSCSLDPTLSNINASSRKQANNVVIEDDFTITIGITETHAAEDPDWLDNLMTSSDVFKVSFVRGTRTGAVLTWTMYATRGPYQFNADGKGEIMASLTLRMVDAINSAGGASLARVRAVT